MKNNKRKMITFIVIGIVLVLFAVVGTLYEKNEKTRNFLDKYVFFKEKYENNLPYIAINGGENLNVFAFKGNILTLKDNILKIYNQNGNEEGTLDIEISNPIFKGNGDYLCIAEKDGKKIYAISNKNILWKKELENNISDVTINSNGYVAVSLTGTIYKTIIQTFDNKGTELFTTFLSSTYAIDMDLSPDNKYLAIAEANFSGILLQSNIKIISIDKAKNGENDYIINTYAGQSGDLIVNIKYQNRSELACVFDNHIEVIKNGTNSTISNFEDAQVLFVDTNSKIVRIIQNEGKTYLQFMSTSGTVRNYEIEEPKNMAISEGMVALNMGSEILFYNNNGWLVKKYYGVQEINKIVISDGIVGIVYNDKIELVSL